VEEIYRPLVPGVVRRANPDLKAAQRAAAEIRAARHPILIVSSRAQRRRVREKLRELCDATNIHVIHTQVGKGVLGDDHPCSLFAFGIHKRDYVNCVVDRADLILTVGYATKEHPPRLWNPHLDKRIISLDFNPARTEIHYNPIVEVVGDISNGLDALRRELTGYRYDVQGMARTREALAQKLFVEGAADDAFPLRPRRIVAECRRVLAAEDILCLDNGIYKLWFSRHYKTFNIGTFIIDNTLATMGAGLPAAIAAKLVSPERRVLAVVGDGGFMMNSQELETAMRLEVPIVVLILNDNSYGFIQWKQRSRGFPDFALELGNPDFVKYAESYGAVGRRIGAAAELAPALEEAFAARRPVVLECAIDYSENIQVWDRELDSIVCHLD
jgi:acetolactate synthase-1/2/3 large subunit